MPTPTPMAGRPGSAADPAAERYGCRSGAAVAKVDAVARATLPASISASFQGAAQAFQSSLRGLGLFGGAVSRGAG